MSTTATDKAALDALRFPTGRFQRPSFPLSPAERARMIEVIAETPAKLRAAVSGLSEQQIDTPYREGGWTVRQLVHHVPDSHINSYVRFRLGLTEDAPTIKTYEESAWAQLADARSAPIEMSLMLLDALHERWVILLRSMTPADWSREITHPEHGRLPLDFFLALYAWHGPHHVAHVTELRKRKGW